MTVNEMYLVTAAEMREIDRHAIEAIGLPAMVLMENAGRAIAEEAVEFARKQGQECGRNGQDSGFRWLILAGKGNNGGDGLVCARHLAEMGYEVGIVYAVHPDELRAEAALQRDIVRKLGLTELPEAVNEDGSWEISWRSWDGIIDALLGTGTTGEPREPYASLIRAANSSGLPIISADIPSGLDADTGAVSDACVKADLTVALAYSKRGLLLHPGAEAAGRVVVRSIGITEGLAKFIGVNTYVLDTSGLTRKLNLQFPQNRPQDSHKGTYGHVLVLAGSAAMSGAGVLCTKAALRGGSGLVSWALPGRLAPEMIGVLPEAMLLGLDDGGSGQWGTGHIPELLAAAKGKQAVVIGPGLGRWEGDAKWLQELWEGIEAPMVIDADALNMWADYRKLANERSQDLSVEANDSVQAPAAWQRREAATIITPHPGEMARLCGLSTPEVQRDRIGIARRFAREQDVIVVLKGARTVVAAPDGDVYVNTTGNPGMSTGGSGDVLAGIIGSLLAQGLDAIQAAALGVYWHGMAGDRAAASRWSNASLIAGDIIDAL